MENKNIIIDLLENPDFRNWVLHPSPENEASFEAFRNQHPDQLEFIDIAKKILLAIEDKGTELDTTKKGAIWESIKKDSGLAQRSKVLPINSEVHQAIPLINRWWIYAAVIIVALSGIFYLNFSKNEEPVIVSAPEMIEKSNGAGQKSKIFLPDGSVVILNSESGLSYDDKFGKTHRKLELEGEAFFDVTRNEKIPFIVKSRNVLTTALGTSFNVNSDSGEAVAVILVTGKVQVNETDSNTSVILNSNEKVCYKMDQGFSDIKKIENLNETLWKDGILVFENNPVPEVLTTLEKWYNVEFQYKGQVDHLTFSGTYDNEYLSNVLKSMAYSVGFEYELNGRIVELKFIKNMDQP